jgi:hypothetical protein
LWGTGWSWKRSGSRFAISEDELAATMGDPVENPRIPGDMDYDADFEGDLIQAVTCDQPMSQGQHYWEVELTGVGTQTCDDRNFFVGVVRPHQDCDNRCSVFKEGVVRKYSWQCWEISHPSCGAYSWHAEYSVSDEHDEGEEELFKQGDHIGVLLDLDVGSLRFFRNGKRLKQEFTSGVTGPLLRSVEVHSEGMVLTALPGAETPMSACGCG